MKNLWACTLLVVMWLIAAPFPTLAQTGSGLAGTVRDTSGALLPGVTVEASSPALIEKVRVVVTDSEGRFSITELNPGRYTVTFSLPGFTTVRREGIDLVTGFTATVNAELPVGSIEESITVTGASPVVDVQNTKQQVVVSRELIDAVPTGKMYQQLGAMIPSVVTNADDVGGLSGQRYTNLTIHGSRTQDTEQQIDGTPLFTWTAIANSTSMISDGAFQEYVFDVSGASAETETGGVRVSMIPRDGGNTFSGGLVANGSHPSLQSSNITPELRARGLRDPNKLKTLWTVNPTFGGPIMRDRVWFFVNYARMISEQYVAGSYLNACLSCWDYTPDLTRQAIDDEIGRDTSLRLTWQATSRHKFTAFLDDNYHCNCHQGIGGVGTGGGGGGADRSEAIRRGESWVNIYQVAWTFPATSRLLLQASAGLAPAPASAANQPEVVAPRIEDSGRGISYRAFGTPSISHKNDVNIYRASVSYVTGSHSVKVGTSVLRGVFDRTHTEFDSLSYTALNGVPTSVTYYRSPYTVLFKVGPNVGLYAQNQWTVKNLTVNAGLRFDYFRSTQPAQTIPPSGYVRQSVSVPFEVALGLKDLNPRFGVSYDVFGNGKTALKGTLNRYGLRMGIQEALTMSAIYANNSNTRRWTDANGDRIVQGDPHTHAANGELGPSQNLAFGQPASSVRFDPDYAFGWGQRPMNWEFSAGVQQELSSGVAMTAMLARRIFGNFPLFENLAVPALSAWDEFCVTAPVDARLPNGGGYQLCGIYDLKPAFVGQRDYVGTRANEYGKRQEHFTAIDVSVNARLRSVMLQGGVSTGKSMTDNCELVKNGPGNSIAASGTRGLSVTSTPTATFCHNESRFNTQFKMSGAYTLPWQEIQVSGVYQDLPGPQILANGTFTNAQVASSLGRPLSQGSTVRIPLVAPGTMYEKRMHQVDFRVAKTVRAGRTRIQGQLDLYNALNVSPIRTYSGQYGATTGPRTGSAFLVPSVILSARLIKVGMQLTF